MGSSTVAKALEVLSIIGFVVLHDPLLILKNLLIAYHNDLDSIKNELIEMG